MMLAFAYKPKFFKQSFLHHLDNFISFPLMYRFVGVRSRRHIRKTEKPLKVNGNLKRGYIILRVGTDTGAVFLVF